ncbi:MAG: OpgC domain-containing protein [Candidatus Manganitrophus sp. SB1]|nr:OpgC domain-containing protein [Candidatus Manganitrophus morganii]
MPKSRNDMLDFMRGLSIFDMILVHYSDFLNLLPDINLSRVIRYSDFAIEGFTLIAGFAVGQHYFGQFKQDKAGVIRRLIERVIEILKVYYLFVLTISIPLAFLVGSRITKADSVWVFVTKSLLFLNQVQLLHILPTFIPLFLLAIPILYLLQKGQDTVVMAVSIGLFAVGNLYPHPFPFGEKAIFPVILWQIYFVIGILLGKRTQSGSGTLYSGKIKVHLSVAVSLFLLMALVYFGHHWFPVWEDLRMEYGLIVRKFPLNYLGLLYHGSILYLVWSVAFLSWKYIKDTRVGGVLLSFGRHSLSVFVIHAYFAMALTFLVPNFFLVPQLFILMNFAVTMLIIKYKESKRVGANYTLERLSV